MKFVVMLRDECGDERRAYGNEFLEKIHEFPDFEDGDEAMTRALWIWQDTIESTAQSMWDEAHAPGECTIFLEREYSDMYRGYHFDCFDSFDW